MSGFYWVEPEGQACKECGHGEMFTVVYRRPGDSEDTQWSQSWECKQEAEEFCDALNEAREMALRSIGGVNDELLEVVKAQHNAMDTLFAQLIILTRRHTPEEQYFPSKSGMVWEAMMRGHGIIQRAQAAMREITHGPDASPTMIRPHDHQQESRP